MNPKRENYSLLIRGGRLIDPAAKIDATMDVLLRDGQVVEIAPPGKTRATAHEKIDARGLIVAPGFIDLHVHLREPGQGYKETIATGTASDYRLGAGISSASTGKRSEAVFSMIQSPLKRHSPCSSSKAICQRPASGASSFPE